MLRLDNPVQRYAWGSPTAIPALLGQPAEGGPVAELWLGAHPAAPSRVRGRAESLSTLLAREPGRLLGERSVKAFGPTLPFLLKVLAAEQPLSLQAHPSLAQAKAGFAREEAAGLARSAPTRCYKDANHKPELLCALTPFEALCGFRAVADTRRLLAGLGLEVTRLDQGLGAYFGWVMGLPPAERTALATRTTTACRERPVKGFEAECAWAVKLAALYPGDVGVVGALLLNLVRLAPGQAIFLSAGNLHAYLHGVGVEVMANSDNVLRGGLTPKHVDVGELLSVLDFRAGPVPVLSPAGAVAVYGTSARDFELTKVSSAAADAPRRFERRGAELWLVTEGSLTLSAGAAREVLPQGQAVFVGADEGPVVLAGQGVAFRATVGP